MRLYELAAAGRWEDAMALQRDLWPINEVFAKYSLAACIKGGLALQGLAVGNPLPPQPPLGNAGLAEVREALERLETL